MKPKLVVSDHAVLRFIQRHYGVDTEAMRAQIAKACSPAHKMGASAVTLDGITFTLVNDCVTTALPGRTSSGARQRQLEAVAS